MRRSTTALMATGLVGALFIAAPGLADGDGEHDPKEAKSKAQTEAPICASEDGSLVVTLLGDQTLWPPNHKYSPLTVTATDSDGDEVALETTVTHDEYTEAHDPNSGEEPPEEQGAGNTVDDAEPFANTGMGTGSATTEHNVRAERSGRGNGRTYTISAAAEGGMDDACMGSVPVEVPHDMGNGAENKKDHTEDS